MAVEPGDFWSSFAESIRASSAEHDRQLQSVYGREPVDLSPFFNLLVVHELAHGFHLKGQCIFPRRWLQEFFCNFCLHAYVVAMEPEALPALETFPRLLTAVDPTQFEHRTWDDFALLCGYMNPLNYGWYQTHLHVAAKRVYEAADVDGLKALWQAFVMPDPLLAGKLRREVHPAVADIMSRWPGEAA